MVQPEATVFMPSFQDSTSYLVLPRPSLAVARSDLGCIIVAFQAAFRNSFQA